MTEVEFIDSKGRPLSEGDTVKLVSAPKELLDGLPESDQAAIKQYVGKHVEIESLSSEYREIELTLTDGEDHTRYIWVAPENVEKLILE